MTVGKIHRLLNEFEDEAEVSADRYGNIWVSVQGPDQAVRWRLIDGAIIREGDTEVRLVDDPTCRVGPAFGIMEPTTESEAPGRT